MEHKKYSNLNQHYIAGKWLEGHSDKIIKNSNPYNQELIFELKAASTEDVDCAYQAASDSFTTWSITSPAERKNLTLKVAEIIQARREEIIDWLIQESGSTRLKANLEVDATLNIIQEAATFPHRVMDSKLKSQDPERRSWVYRQALGVIAVISPWNFPLHLSMRSVAAAIALGNTVVLKPATDTPVTGGILLAKIFEEAGIPAGVLNVVAGSGSEIGDYFVEHKVPKLISFTGSTQVGQRVGQLAVGGKYLKRIALELGGNAPLVILDDADLDLAVELTVMGRFLHQGQICMSTNRVIVDASIYQAYVDKLVKRTQSIVVGDPNKADTLIGPIINQAQVEKIKKIIQQAEQDGAKLIVQSEIKGSVVPPHIFVDVDPNSSLSKDESFGPVLPIIQAKDEAHALQLANDTHFGLSSAVCTADYERGVAFALKIDAGMTHINAITVVDQANAPFGGEKNSGLGRFNGQWILEEFTRTHWITVPKDQ